MYSRKFGEEIETTRPDPEYKPKGRKPRQKEEVPPKKSGKGRDAPPVETETKRGRGRPKKAEQIAEKAPSKAPPKAQNRVEKKALPQEKEGGILGRLLSGGMSTQDLLLIGLIFLLVMEDADDDILLILAALLFISS